MAKTSVLIPARRETYVTGNGQTTLARTVDEVFSKARGEFDVTVGFDGQPYEPLTERKGLTVFYYPRAMGTKPLLNTLVYMATGRFVMKLDAHCSLSEGFDVELQSECGDCDIVTPRFYTLDPKLWQWQDSRFCDYFQLPCPLTDPRLYRFQAGGYWRERTQARLGIAVDENMKLHGSTFFMQRSFYERMDGLDESHPDSASGEDIELPLKAWLGPWQGKVLVNKRAWVAHMHKGREQPRSWNASQRAINASYEYTANYWMSNRWANRAKNIDWLIDHFWPVPGWPDDWQERQAQHERDLSVSHTEAQHPL